MSSLATAPLGASHRMQMLGLYKNTLRQLQTFPSKNRLRMIKEVRVEFKRNKGESDPQKVKAMIEEVNVGVNTMLQFNGGRSGVYTCQ
ncbi:hypothetical protein PROFUN_08369 [Planoprotostelium fungivorum]|uniref:Complex 1 LYR protein domain-containing protein n=1 Tax=Planoprotostelium fungivorum TaxID=1890364 RepID=A0A2P6NJR1_9EUKA|nr:hypothetical protein PROFUN_08369 [Planoprotostelium fungivorum]